MDDDDKATGEIETGEREMPIETKPASPTATATSPSGGGNGEQLVSMIEQLHKLVQERDRLKEVNHTLDDNLEQSRIELNRMVALKMEMEDRVERMERKYEGLSKDYEETMLERGSVLEENSRLTEERDRLSDSVRHLSTTLHNMLNCKARVAMIINNQSSVSMITRFQAEQNVQELSSKLEHTRRLLQLNMEETTAANARRNDALAEIGVLRRRCAELEAERDAAHTARHLTRLTPPCPQWSVHSFQINLRNLGLVLGGGRSDELLASGTPIYVKQVQSGSPLSHYLRRFDHLLLVNDIDVSGMDQRSVTDILRNKLGVQFENGIFVTGLDEDGAAAAAGVSVSDRLLFINDMPVYDAAQAARLVRDLSGCVVLGMLKEGREQENVSRKITTVSETAQADSVSISHSPPPVTKSKSTFLNKMHDKLFGRGSSTSEKNRAVIAQANIGDGSSWSRHGSLRVPAARVPQKTREQWSRAGSLRMPSSVRTSGRMDPDARAIFQHLDQYLNEQASKCVPEGQGDDASGSTWPKLRGETPLSGVVATRLAPPSSRPSLFPVFPQVDGNAGAISSSGVSSSFSSSQSTRPPSWYPQPPPPPPPPSSAPPPTVERSGNTLVAAASSRHGSVETGTFHNNRPPPPLTTESRGSLCLDRVAWDGGAPATLVTSQTMGIAHATRVAGVGGGSAGLPQPPPYPGRRTSNDSLSSSSMTPSSRNRLTTDCSRSNSGTHLSESVGSDETPTRGGGGTIGDGGGTRSVCISRDQGGTKDYGICLETGARGGVVVSAVYGTAHGLVNVGDQLLDISGINMRSMDKASATRVLRQFSRSHDQVSVLIRPGNQSSPISSPSNSPRWARAPRASLRLCGGNALGILVEQPTGEVLPGDRVLELNGLNMRRATLEEAVLELEAAQGDTVRLLVEHDPQRLRQLRSGAADGDSLHVRVHCDRPSQNSDELDLRQGEVVYVDNTLFMGRPGRWRAWRLDAQGRQRQCGIIPSQLTLKQETRFPRSPTTVSPLYERVERVACATSRPVVLISALVDPFVQMLVDEHSAQFGECVPECRPLSAAEVDRALSTGQLIDARRRDRLFEVVSTAALRDIADRRLHCLLKISPEAVQRLHSIHIYPIILRVKFKTAKQVKELAEETSGERLTLKTVKELIERAERQEQQLASLGLVNSTVLVSSAAGPPKHCLKQACQQIVAAVEHEQKKTVWLPEDPHEAQLSHV